MTLKEYLYSQGIDPFQFAYDTDIPIACVYRYLRGYGMWRERAKTIEQYTKGNVTLAELKIKDKACPRKKKNSTA
jgi:hypothetical protein